MMLFFFLSPSLLFFWWFKTMWAGVFIVSNHVRNITSGHQRAFLRAELSWDVAVVSSFSVPSDNVQRVIELLCAEWSDWTLLDLSTVKCHRPPFSCPPGKAEKPETCWRMSFLLYCFLLSFSFPVFFLLSFSFSLKASHAPNSPFWANARNSRNPAEHLFVCMGRTFFFFFFFNSAASSGLETFHCGQDAESVPEILASLSRKCVETFSYLFYLPLRRSAGVKRWRPGRWCVPCSSSSPASPRSCRSSRATSSRCSASWMSSGCWATRTASQVKPLWSTADRSNSFVQPELASKNHTVFWGR